MPFQDRYWPAVPYDSAAEVNQTGSHEYRCRIHPEYSHGPAAHGGFVIAVIWRAIKLHFGTTLAEYQQLATFSFHVEFVRPSAPGDAVILIKDVRLGKASSTVQATLLQQGQECVFASAINASTTASKLSISRHLGHGFPASMPPIDLAAVVEGNDPHWLRVDYEWQPERPDHALCNAIFVYPRRPHDERRVVQQWTAPRLAHEKWTTDQLGIVFDHHIMPLENFLPDANHDAYSVSQRAVRNEREGKSTYDHPGWTVNRWYPTLNFSINVVRQLPAEGVRWLFVQHTCREVKDGRLGMNAEIFDPEGNLIATSQSLSLVVPARRTTSKSATAQIGTKQSKM